MNFLVIDTGMHVDTARQLGRHGHTVYYYASGNTAYSQFTRAGGGTGVPEITKVLDFGAYIDKADVIVFPDVGYGELAKYLRSTGKVVFGAGPGERMEQDRMYSVKIMDRLGIKHPETFVVHGVKEAMAKIRDLVGTVTETNQSAGGKLFVKINVWRGSVDTFPVTSVEEAEYMFDNLRAGFGPYAQSMEIIIQRKVEGIECGVDLFFDGRDFLKPGMIGFEKGNSYIGYVTDDLSIFKNDLTKAAKYLREMDYRGAFSTECIYDGKDCYWIDWTTRFPMPLGMIYVTYADDLGALLHEVASSTSKSSRLPKGEFLGCMPVSTEEALTRWIPLKVGKNTRLFNYIVDGDQEFAIPGISIVAAVMARGNSMKEVSEGFEKEAEKLKIYFSSYDSDIGDTIRETYIEPLKKLGFDFDALVSKKKEQHKTEALIHDLRSIMR